MSQRAYKLEEKFPKLPREEGWWLCRYCGKRISRERRYRAWCSAKCTEEAMIRCYPQSASGHVLKRDKGVCAACGLQTEELRAALERVRRSKWNGGPERLLRELYKTVTHAMMARGFDLMTCGNWGHIPALHHIDHVISVAEGGELEPENLQTLCVPCHKAKTAKAKRKP